MCYIKSRIYATEGSRKKIEQTPSLFHLLRKLTTEMTFENFYRGICLEVLCDECLVEIAWHQAPHLFSVELTLEVDILLRVLLHCRRRVSTATCSSATRRKGSNRRRRWSRCWCSSTLQEKICSRSSNR